MSDARRYVQRIIRLSALRSMRRGYSVYVLFIDGDLVYVGQTSDPTTRLAQHRHGRSASHVRLRVICVVETQDEAVRVESAYIDVLRKQGYELLNCEHFTRGGAPPGFVGELGLAAPIGGSERLTHAMTHEEILEQRRKIRSMIEGNARLAEVYK